MIYNIENLRSDTPMVRDKTRAGHPFFHSQPQNFEILEVNEQLVLNIIQSLSNKKSFGDDGMSPYILKRVASDIITPLTKISLLF